MPSEHTATFVPHRDIDIDGFDVDGLGVTIGPRVGGLQLSAPAVIPDRFASSAKMLAFHSQFKHVSTQDYGPDRWAVVQEWEPGLCMMHGWSAAAGLTCDVFKAPCDKMETWVKACGTLRGGLKPNASETSAGFAFRGLAPSVAMTVARGIARNNSSAVFSAAPPEGVTVQGRAQSKPFTQAAFDDARGEQSIAQFVAPEFYADESAGEEEFGWTSDAPAQDAAESVVFFSSGYGEVPFFRLKQSGETWHVVAFGVLDIGEP